MMDFMFSSSSMDFSSLVFRTIVREVRPDTFTVYGQAKSELSIYITVGFLLSRMEMNERCETEYL